MPRTPKPNPDEARPVDSMDYESAVEELESLIERIESGEAALEESIRFYERGTRLLRRCREILDQAEQRIERLDTGSLDASDAKAGDA